MIGRRRFLGMLGVGAAAAPLAGQQVITAGYASHAAGMQIGVSSSDASNPPGLDPWEQAKRAFTDPKTFDNVRSMLFEEQKIVGAIDHDLASKRSFSLAAKVTFQRQRNVERRMDEMKTEYTGSRIYGAIRKAISPFG